jgi:hypothetical protein
MRMSERRGYTPEDSGKEAVLPNGGSSTANKDYVITDDHAGRIASVDKAPEPESRPYPRWGSLIFRSSMDAEGNDLGKTPDGENLFSYRALDTGEVLWVGTISDALEWARASVGIEPIDRHAAYWERRYAARRFTRRLGNLPSYADLFAEHRQTIALLRDLVSALDRGLEPDQRVLDHVKERYMQKPTVYDLERV